MQTLAGADASLSRVWQVPDKPLSICVSRDVIDGIQRRGKRRFLRRRAEAGGILLGAVEHDGEDVTIRVEEFEKVPCEHLFGPAYSLSESDKENLRTTLQRAKSEGRFFPVGFYRTHARRGYNLDPDDQLLFSEFFPDANDIALLVKRRAIRSNRAAFFLRGDDAAGEPQPSLEVALRGGQRRKSSVPEPSDKQEAPKSAAVRQQGIPLWCSCWMQAPLLLSLILAYGVTGFFAAQQIDKLAPAAYAQRDPYALSLTVLDYGDNLHVIWDRHALPIASGVHGFLQITDGDQTHSMDLSLSQLQSASVVYRRVNTQVRFRLEILLKDRRSVSETWEPLGGAFTPEPAAAGNAEAAAHP